MVCLLISPNNERSIQRDGHRRDETEMIIRHHLVNLFGSSYSWTTRRYSSLWAPPFVLALFTLCCLCVLFCLFTFFLPSSLTFSLPSAKTALVPATGRQHQRIYNKYILIRDCNGSEVLAEQDGIDWCLVALQDAGVLEITDSIEAQGVPDLHACNVCNKHEVEHGVGVSQYWGPLEIRAAQCLANALSSEAWVDEKPSIAVVGASAHVVWFDVVGTKHHLFPFGGWSQGDIGAVEQDRSECAKPVIREFGAGQLVQLWIGVALFDLLVKLLIQEVNEARRKLGGV